MEEGSLFLTPNLTVVEAHVGSSTSLDCTVARDSDHGMVRSHQNNNDDDDKSNGDLGKHSKGSHPKKTQFKL